MTTFRHDEAYLTEGAPDRVWNTAAQRAVALEAFEGIKWNVTGPLGREALALAYGVDEFPKCTRRCCWPNSLTGRITADMPMYHDVGRDLAWNYGIGIEQEKPVTDLKPGRRVRVSYETTVSDLLYSHQNKDTVTVAHPSRWSTGVTRVPRSAVELIDDPASDPIGTVRKGFPKYSTLKRTLVKSADREYPWKDVTVSGSSNLLNEAVKGFEIIGAVPGTPAAEQ